MKKELVSILLLFFILPNALAQFKKFSGIVTDEETHQPIAWVHLLLKENGTGTVSNAEGQFAINVPIDISSATLNVSIVGYKSRLITLPPDETNNLKISLVPDIKMLSEIIVRPIDTRELILEAVKKIPQNYPSRPIMLTGFYRESLRYDSANYIYISEAILKARKESYNEANHKGQVKLLKARKKEFEDSLQALKKIHFYAGPHLIHSRDFVINRFDFVNESKIKKYNYTIKNITLFNNREVYEISFKPNTMGGTFEGTLFLDVDSGAIIRAYYKLTNAGLRQENAFGKLSRFLNREFLINFMQVGTNRWVVQNIWQQGTLKVNALNNNIIYANEFVTTEVDTTNTSSFLYDERFQYGDFFIDKANNLDPSFWDNFNILKENSFIHQIQDKEVNAKSISTDYSPVINKTESTRIAKRKVKYSFDLAVTSIFPDYSNSNVNLTGNGFNISAFIESPSPVTLGFYSSFEVHLQKNFRLVFGSVSSFGNLAFDNVSIGVGHRITTKIKTRPLCFISGFNFSYNNLRLPIGVVEGPLSINDKILNDDLDVKMQKTFYSFQPSVKLSLELSRRWDFFVSANFLLNLNSVDKILFKEKEGFFLTRKSSSLNTIDSSVDFRVNGVASQFVPISVSSLFLSAGITFKYTR